MSTRSTPLQAAISNSKSSYPRPQGGGMDGSEQQINQSQQGNRTTTQGDQAPDSSGGTGGGSGGAAGPGGGHAGASGHGKGSAGGSGGSSGGAPMGGQQVGRFVTSGVHGERISFDIYSTTEDVTVTHHFAIGIPTSDMSSFALHFTWTEVIPGCTTGYTICECKNS